MYVQVRFELIYRSEISYLTVHLHEKAQKDVSFDMMLKHSKQEIKKMMVGHEKDAHLNKKKRMIIKITPNVHEKPQKRDKKPRFEQKCNILARFNLYYVSKGDQFTIKLSFFPANSPLSSQNI